MVSISMIHCLSLCSTVIPAKNGKHFIIFGAKVSINIEVRNIPHVFFVFHEKKRKIVAAAMLRHGGTSERHRLEWPQQCCGTEDRDDDTNWNGRSGAACLHSTGLQAGLLCRSSATAMK